MILCDKCAKPIRSCNRMGLHFISMEENKPNQIAAGDWCDQCAKTVIDSLVALVKASKSAPKAPALVAPIGWDKIDGGKSAPDIALPADPQSLALEHAGIVPR